MKHRLRLATLAHQRTPSLGTLSVAAAYAAICLGTLAGLPRPALAQGQLRRDVSLSKYSEHSSHAELARRLLSPLASVRLHRALAHAGGAFAGQPLNLSGEKFILYLPAQRPAQGFGLLVFIPPWEDARLP